MSGNLLRHPIFGADAPADASRHVAHYTTLDAAAAIADSMSFRLSPMSRMNDPREFKSPEPMTFHVGAPPLSRTEIDAAIALVQQERLNVRAASFTIDMADGKADSSVRANGRAYARPSLWAHYGDKHRGVCLLFDRPALEAALSGAFGLDVVTRRVEYVHGFDPSDWGRYLDLNEVARLGIPAGVAAHLLQHRERIFFEKNSDWNSEREWRCCVFNQAPASTTQLPLAPGMVGGLLVGLDLAEAHLTEVERIASKLGLTDAVARIYIHQLNVLDVLPLNQSTSPWSYLTPPELRSIGYL
jgi:hypothetical protein